MGHHHHRHHHHRHHHGGGLRGGFGGGFGYGGGVGTSWPLAAAIAGLLVAYGLVDGLSTYRVYAHGQHGMGVVTRVHDGTTILEVEGNVCAVSGEFGHVGGVLPVAFPPGRPGGCVVHQLGVFRWAGGALFFGAAILTALWAWRRGAPSGGGGGPTTGGPSSA